MNKTEERAKDVAFLEEMKQCAIKAFERNDVVSREMLLRMIDDWITELKNKKDEHRPKS